MSRDSEREAAQAISPAIAASDLERGTIYAGSPAVKLKESARYEVSGA
jgi:hypothetical protein